MTDFNTDGSITVSTEESTEEPTTTFEASSSSEITLEEVLEIMAAFTTDGSRKDFTEYDRIKVVSTAVFNYAYALKFKQTEAASEDEDLVRYAEFIEGLDGIDKVIFVTALPTEDINEEAIYVLTTSSRIYYYNSGWRLLGGGGSAPYAIFVTNVEPQDPNKRVDVTYNPEPNEESVLSFISDTDDVYITIEWDRNASGYVGEPVVNGNIVSDYDTKDGVTYTKRVATSLSNNAVPVVFGDNAYSVGYSKIQAPVFENLSPSFTVDSLLQQEEFKENDILQIRIECQSEFNEIEILDFGACKYKSENAGGQLTYTIDCIVANRGDSLQQLTAKLRVRGINGAWTDYIETSNTAPINNLHPNSDINDSVITYPLGQEAISGLPGSNTATIELDGNAGYTDSITVSYEGTQMNLYRGSDDTLLSNGDDVTLEITIYAVSKGVTAVTNTDNVTFTLVRDANNSTTISGIEVEIMDFAPTVTSTNNPNVRLGENNINVNTTFDQGVKLTSVLLTGSKGSTTASTTSVFNNTISIPISANTNDDYADNSQAYATIEVINKSGLTSTFNAPYKVRGFVPQLVTFTAPSRSESIPVQVTDSSKLIMDGDINTSPSFPITGVFVDPSLWADDDLSLAVNKYTIEDVTESGGFASILKLSPAVADFGYTSPITITINLEETI